MVPFAPASVVVSANSTVPTEYSVRIVAVVVAGQRSADGTSLSLAESVR